MKKVYLFLFSLLLVVAACKNEKPQEVYNPFATPEGCIKEYLDARDSCDIVRMLKCYSYEPKYESIIREGLQKSLDDDARKKMYHPDYYYRTDSIKLKETYPNTAVVTVYYTDGYTKDDISPFDYDMNLVKDSTNWKIETQLSYSIIIKN